MGTSSDFMDSEFDDKIDNENGYELDGVFEYPIKPSDCYRISDNVASTYMYEYTELPCPQENIASIFKDIRDVIISSEVTICKHFSNETLADYIVKHIKIINSLV